MRPAAADVRQILQRLELHYGPQEPCWPTDPYQFLLWWYSGYPASDAACAKGWTSLSTTVGTEPRQILAASTTKLASALKPGGMFPELRAVRLMELAARVQDEFGGDLRSALTGPIARARKVLKSFPSIGDPGADRILLFAGLAPVAAVPSNVVHVLVRILGVPESLNYAAAYKQAQEAISEEVEGNFDARARAYLLLKRHGQEICKPTKPRCEGCPVNSACAYAATAEAGVPPGRR
jgi:endonuclease III